MNADDVLRVLEGTPLAGRVNRAQIQGILTDKLSMYQAEAESECRWEIWDKKSPINGVPAEDMIRTYGIEPEDEVFLLRNKDGLVELFQPVVPGVPGNVKMKGGEAAAWAQRTHAERVSTAVLNKVIMEIANTVGRSPLDRQTL